MSRVRESILKEINQDLNGSSPSPGEWSDLSRFYPIVERQRDILVSVMGKEKYQLREQLLKLTKHSIEWLQVIDQSEGLPDAEIGMRDEDYKGLEAASHLWDFCTKCDLCKNKQTRMFDRGMNPNSYLGVVFIGEGPGKTEKENGIPFSGEAGVRVFNSVLSRLGLTRAQIYVTNIVKHRAETEEGKDRTPSEQEVSICTSTWLLKEMAYADPRVIIPLGATAITALGIKGTVTHVAGVQVQSPLFKGVPVVPLAHPAYLLHQGSEDNKKQYLEAVGRLKDILVEKGILIKGD
jgi:uracil-DNA glycosylase family 4